jgi:hypothetical protein
MCVAASLHTMSFRMRGRHTTTEVRGKPGYMRHIHTHTHTGVLPCPGKVDRVWNIQNVRGVSKFVACWYYICALPLFVISFSMPLFSFPQFYFFFLVSCFIICHTWEYFHACLHLMFCTKDSLRIVSASIVVHILLGNKVAATRYIYSL